MNEPNLRRNFIANISISLFTILLPTLFLFFAIKEGLILSFANDVVNEMAAIDMVQKKYEGEYYDEDTHMIDFIKRLPNSERNQKTIRRRYNEISFMFSLLPIIIILMLIFVKGWSNIKSKVKQIDKSIIESQIPITNGLKNIKWYVSVY